MADDSTPDDVNDTDQFPPVESPVKGSDFASAPGEADDGEADDNSDQSPRAEAKVEGSNAASLRNLLQLDSRGPVVKCVILRAAKPTPTPPAAEEPESTESASSLGDSAKKSGAPSEPGSSNIREEEEDVSKEQSETVQPEIFEDLIEEIEIDTTPQKNEVETLLGGPFTFIGQYESEGIVLMALREQGVPENADNDFEKMTISELKSKCREWGVCTQNMVERRELVDALKKKESELPPLNPHRLQPPLHDAKVRGDIVIMKVAPVDDPVDESDDENEDDEAANDDVDDNDKSDKEPVGNDAGDKEETIPSKTGEGDEDDKHEASSPYIGIKESEAAGLHIPPNDEFFLPYTKDEYLAFASRTDVEQPGAIGGESEDIENAGREGGDNNGEYGNEDEGEHDDGDFHMAAVGMEELTEEEEKCAMLNIVMSELLRKFREENGRGPNSREVLEIRASVAEQLGMEVATYDETQEAEVEAENAQAEAGRKREGDSATDDSPARKRVKFDSSLNSDQVVEEAEGEEAEVEEAEGGEAEGEELNESKQSANESEALPTAQQEENG